MDGIPPDIFSGITCEEDVLTNNPNVSRPNPQPETPHPVRIKVTCRREQMKNFFSSLIVLIFHPEPAHEPSLCAK
ncbi:hypothetical protein CROQUDRAFT_650480 [Cronartium quercuum f. sp. fusiforme G11]|uniref:Uncharacterized protein n=1 Tax=Cronartium quercuum f. sp. fusiforme G11 TaxID=708437 RepID=A0A9P6TIK7_9BASI|nr:hypothetical protein CROQUDRAFT_650480 [Cronartium quercuum f. sp. fusiforme G11]